MLAAQLMGKLTRREEDLEDLLTSNVFGSIKYVPPEDGLIPILCAAETDAESEEERYPFENLQISKVKYEFWYHLQEQNCDGCIPDVLINIEQSNGENLIVLVEAKYLSGTPVGQLTREWNNLEILARKSNAIPYLLYLTADFRYPKKEIDSEKEFLKKLGKKMDVLWVSWRMLPKLFTEKNLTEKHCIIKDLVKVLENQNLTFFKGTSIPKQIELIEWSFQTKASDLDWSKYQTFDIQWKYQSFKTNWNTERYSIKLRFVV
jgi:hypothetical protein